MSADDDALDAEALSLFLPPELLPPSLQRWHPLVLQGLAWFLGALPAAHRERTLQAQFELPFDAPAQARLLALLESSPTLHKLGQVLARQPHLDATLKASLIALESMPARWSEADRAHAQSRLGALPDAPRFEVEEQPLAQGSVARVVGLHWRAGGRRHEAVAKMLKPGVAERLAAELALLPAAADQLERLGRELGLPALDYHGTLGGIRMLLAEEIRLDTEQQHLRAAGARLAHAARAVLVPATLPWSAPWVTLMERVRGRPLADASVGLPMRRLLAHRAMRRLIAEPFWSTDDPAFFHGDLHGGNLWLADDGRLAVLDWALAARVSKPAREAVVQAILAGATLNLRALETAIDALGPHDAATAPVRRRVMAEAIDDLASGRQVAGFDWLLGLFDALALDGLLKLDAGLAVFRKSWLQLAGVLRDLGGGHTPDAVLAHAGLSALQRDALGRTAWSGMTAGREDHASHLASADLIKAGVSAGLTPARWALRAWRQRD